MTQWRHGAMTPLRKYSACDRLVMLHRLQRFAKGLADTEPETPKAARRRPPHVRQMLGIDWS
jgi:hypothetical protein